MTSQGEGQEEQESPIPLQVFEFQIDPDRNAIIRRALAKRIVHQRELDEEEASTEEDESFLAGDRIAVRRSIASTPVSPRKRTPEGQQQGKMNAKSRWKTEYLRTRSSSPSGSSICAPEVVVVEGSTSVPESSDTKPNGDTLIAHEKLKKDDATDHTGSEPNLMGMDKDKDKEPVQSVSETAPSEETKETDSGVRTAREPSPDLVEEELLAKLENLKKEKSRLFALFRSTLQKREEGSSTAPTFTSSAQQPSQPPLPPPPPPPPPPIPPQMPAEMRARESAKRASDGKETSKTEDHEKRNDTPRSIPKRREGERVIDRSKLNLEIPRKPSVSSSTTNSASSTSSTPTFGPYSSGTSFSYPQKLKPKRPRSISPTHAHPSQSTTTSSNNNNNTSSIAGRGTSNYSEPSSSKFPRADYGPPSSTSSSHSRNSSNSSTFGSHMTNVLPEKPQVRYPGGNRSHHNGSANDDQYHRTSNKASGSGSGSGSSGNLLSSSSISSLSGHGANGGGNSGYRQQHSSSYHPQGPSRGGFGMRGRGGYFGHGEGGLGSGSNSGGGPISLLGPPGRPLPFNRNMMQMPHTRGPFHSRLGFGRGGGGEDDGRGRGRGGIGRHPSSPRGEWPHRRSRD